MRILTTSLTLLLVSSALCGCASTNHNPKDPFESFNRKVYQFNDTVDKAVVKPVAKGYNVVVPVPAKMMLSNFFSNLNDVIVAVNDLLQFKLVHAISDTGRIAVNTTVGLYGLVDIASVVGLEKHDEDFGQTLGRWGLGSGPYLMGDTLSRADVTVASLLAPLTCPPEHLLRWPASFPEELGAFVDEFRDRPTWEFVRRMYREHRHER